MVVKRKDACWEDWVEEDEEKGSGGWQEQEVSCRQAQKKSKKFFFLIQIMQFKEKFPRNNLKRQL